MSPIYVVSSYMRDEQQHLAGLQYPEAYTTLDEANDAAVEMMKRFQERLNKRKNGKYTFNFSINPKGCYDGDATVEPGNMIMAKIRVHITDLKGKSAAKTSRSKAKVEEEEDEEAEEEEKDEDERPKTTKRKVAVPRTTAPNPQTLKKLLQRAQPNALHDLKLLFTGTFQHMDRKTSIATATSHGATMVTKLEDADYVVVGVRAGAKKLREINEKELETIGEEEFFEMLERGVSKGERGRIEARRRADAVEGPGGGDEGEEEEEEVQEVEEKTKVKRGRKRARK